MKKILFLLAFSFLLISCDKEEVIIEKNNPNNSVLVEEAPNDGEAYVRKSENWVLLGSQIGTGGQVTSAVNSKRFVAHVSSPDGNTAYLDVKLNTFDDVPLFNIIKQGTGQYALYYSGGGLYFNNQNCNITITPRGHSGYVPYYKWETGSTARELKLKSYDLANISNSSSYSDYGFDTGGLDILTIDIEYFY